MERLHVKGEIAGFTVLTRGDVTASPVRALMMIAIVMTMWYPSRKRSTPFRWRWSIFLTAVLLTAADFLYFYALSDPQALLSVVSTIRRSGVVVTFVAGALMFRERQIGTKAALLAVVLSGVALLYFG